MNNQTLSDIFAWAAVMVPAAIGVFNAVRGAPWFPTVVPVLIAAVAGAGLHFRNVVSEEKDKVIDSLKERSLSAQQAESLHRALSKTPGVVGFNTVMFEAESRRYAETIAAVFRSSGWTVKYIAGNMTGDIGMAVVGVKKKDDIAKAKMVCEALNIAQIGCQDYASDDKFLEEVVTIMVGQKPRL